MSSANEPPQTVSEHSGAEAMSQAATSSTITSDSSSAEQPDHGSDDVEDVSLDAAGSDDTVEPDDIVISEISTDPMSMVMDWEEVSSEASDAINNVVDNIIDRMRIERMFELRRLQHGDRAVSSGDRIEQLEELFTRSTNNETVRRVPRAEGVRDELEQLARNRSVGNLLNTRFRTLLEDSLAGLRTPETARLAPATGSRPVAQLPPLVIPSGRTAPPPAAPIPGNNRHAPPAPRTEYIPPDYNERQFDYAITDVEELFQRRLVSDVLHSAFRNVLELHIERRLVRQGVRPQRQYIPQQPPDPRQQLPQMSPIVAPMSSRRLPEIERQVHSMSIELKEMKNMLKLLVDTQMDIQRSIRQEVNALMRNSTIQPSPPTPQIKDGTCVVCLEFPCDTVLYRCGHLCSCFSCARQLRVEGHHCPVCRAEVTDILRIYRSSTDNA